MRTAMDVLRMTGVLRPRRRADSATSCSTRLAIVGKTMLGILEGSVDPQQFIPRMIELWQAGRFPFDRMIEKFPMSQINEAEQASLSRPGHQAGPHPRLVTPGRTRRSTSRARRGGCQPTSEMASRSMACWAWRFAIKVSIWSPRSVTSARTAAMTLMTTPCNVPQR